MPLIHARMGDTVGSKYSDTEDVVVPGGMHKELLVNELMGRYYNLMRRGRIFNASTVVTGVAFPITTSVAPVFSFWNPSDSGVIWVPLVYSCAYVSGTNVQTPVGLQNIPNAGSAIGATGAPVTAFTAGTVTNALLGGPAGGKVRYGTAATTIASTFYCTLGMNTYTGAATVPVGITPPVVMDLMGLIGVPPGNFVYTAGNVASVGLYQQSMWYIEVPV